VAPRRYTLESCAHLCFEGHPHTSVSNPQYIKYMREGGLSLIAWQIDIMIRKFRDWMENVSHPRIMQQARCSDNLKLSLRRETRAVPPVRSQHRKRRLTIPLPVDQAGPKQTTASQEQSSFFSKLPLEVRLMIYREVFGNREIHIAYEYSETKRKWELWSIECFSPSPFWLGQGDVCREGWGRQRKLSPRDYSRGERFCWSKVEFSLLLSCRQA
jgi:hypothetical protein